MKKVGNILHCIMDLCTYVPHLSTELEIVVTGVQLCCEDTNICMKQSHPKFLQLYIQHTNKHTYTR